jgi:tRNA dimethylallyltransferase
MTEPIKLPVIVGPTASGKTKLAAQCAYYLGAEIISADSRQVYKGMDIGTGKDIDDYVVNNYAIPYHLIDIVDAGYTYNLYEFKRDFITVFNSLFEKGKKAIVCGGSGLYTEAIIKQYELHEVPQNIEFRKKCEQRSFEELIEELKLYKTLHNKTDIDTKKRVIRALEIAKYEQTYGTQIQFQKLPYEPIVIGIEIDRESRRQRILSRLQLRMQQGMTHEVEHLLSQGVTPEKLMYYGLEYKYITLYVTGKITEKQMFDELYIAICQFAKRQMTWYRGMERRGIQIHWINGNTSIEKATQEAIEIINKSKTT